jgi:hypothetical protein
MEPPTPNLPPTDSDDAPPARYSTVSLHGGIHRQLENNYDVGITGSIINHILSMLPIRWGQQIKTVSNLNCVSAEMTSSHLNKPLISSRGKIK